MDLIPDIIKKDLDKFETYYKVPWADVNANNMEDEIRALMKTLGYNKIDKKANV